MPYNIIIGRDNADKTRFGKKGVILLGKSYVTMSNSVSLSNPIYLDTARSHVVLITGKRGSGKSYSISVIAEELSLLPEVENNNIASLIFDTMGIFWTMKYKNEKDASLLADWKLKAKQLSVRVLVPFGLKEDYEKKQISIDGSFAISPSDMQIEDWITTFNLNMTEPIAIFMQNSIKYISSKKEDFEIDDIISYMERDKTAGQEVKNAAAALFQAVKSWNIFSAKDSAKTSKIIQAGTTTILDISTYSSAGAFNVRALIIGIISRKLFKERMNERKKEEIYTIQHGIEQNANSIKREIPLLWLFIDEVHEFLPINGKTAATDTLNQLLREGRQPGISLVMATQQPSSLSKDAMTQADIVISHKLTSMTDIKALNEMMQSYQLQSIKEYFDNLPNIKGAAIILDDNSERLYPIQVRPKLTWHGGESPVSV